MVSNNVRFVVKAIKRMSDLGKDVQRMSDLNYYVITNSSTHAAHLLSPPSGALAEGLEGRCVDKLLTSYQWPYVSNL